MVDLAVDVMCCKLYNKFNIFKPQQIYCLDVLSLTISQLTSRILFIHQLLEGRAKGCLLEKCSAE